MAASMPSCRSPSSLVPSGSAAASCACSPSRSRLAALRSSSCRSASPPSRSGSSGVARVARKGAAERGPHLLGRARLRQRQPDGGLFGFVNALGLERHVGRLAPLQRLERLAPPAVQVDGSLRLRLVARAGALVLGHLRRALAGAAELRVGLRL